MIKRNLWIIALFLLILAGTTSFYLLTGPSDAGSASTECLPLEKLNKEHAIEYEKGAEFFEVIENEQIELMAGVTYERVALKGGDRMENLLGTMNLVAVDLDQPCLTAKIVSADEQVLSKKAVTRIANSHTDESQQVIVGANLDFFDMSIGMPRGLQITDGELITSTTLLGTFFGVLADGQFVLDQGMVIDLVVQLEDGTELELDGINKVRHKNLTGHAFLMTDRFGRSTRSDGEGIEVVISPVDESTSLHAGEIKTGIVEEMITGSNQNIPDGKLILTASGKKAEWIQTHIKEGTTIQFHSNFSKEIAHEVTYALGGQHNLAKTLLLDGEVPTLVSRVSSSANLDRHPRTIIASKDDLLYMITFDGRQANYADGISLKDAALYLQALEFDYAVNVDGGGSTTLVGLLPEEDFVKVLNRPSGTTQRDVANALLIIKEREGEQ